MKLSREQVAERLSHGDSPRDLSGTDLTGLDLSRMDLRGANLSRADLSAADLRWALLEGADLHSSVLRRADCRWAVMRGANLRQADLGRANLSWADVTNADLTGAQLDGANLENVDLADGYADRGFGSGRGLSLGGVGSISLPRSRGLALVWTAAGMLLAVQVWGWLYRRSFFGEFGISDDTLMKFTAGANLTAGLGVAWLTAKTLLVTPFVMALLAVLTLILIVVPAALVLLGDRVLKSSVNRQFRAPATIGLFGVFFLLAWAVLIPALRNAGGWLLSRALPAEAGLRAAFTLATRNLLMALGLVLGVAAAFYLLYLGWRLASREMARRDLPARWRIQYPRLNDAYAALRASRAAGRNTPLSPEERRNGIGSLAALALLLPVLLAFTGRVDAYHAMCDGDALSRVQLFTNRAPGTPPVDTAICSRLVAQTDAWVWVYFPAETERMNVVEAAAAALATPTAEAGAPELREAGIVAPATAQPVSPLPDDPREFRHVAKVYKVARTDIVWMVTADAATGSCATCVAGASGEERFLIDPDEVLIGGIVAEVTTTGLATLSEPTTSISAFQIQADTQVLVDGEAGDATEVRPGRRVTAIGTVDSAGTLLGITRQVNVQTTGGPALVPDMRVTFQPDQSAFIVSGEKWRPGSQLRVGLAAAGTSLISQPLGDGTIQVSPAGTFSAPMSFDPSYPTGPAWTVLVSDEAAGVYVSAPWFAQPPPTPVPTPTSLPAPTEGPIGTVEATAPPEELATNTPIVTLRGIGGFGNCEPDTFEPDNGLHQAKEIFVSFAADGAAPAHTFCPVGDLDLAFFRVKRGRWYRVFTQNLAPGVDTVIQVGDLSPSTPCQPGGCWNDDKAALTYASEVIFQAVEDDTAFITVDNFGSAYGSEATYELGVVEFQPEPTPTITPLPSSTATPTPKASTTPKPAADSCDDGSVGNNTCANACLLGFDPYFGTINKSTDQDWFRTIALGAGSYRLYLEPPEGRDYDYRLYTAPCPGVVVFQGRESGDSPEDRTFDVLVDGSVFYVSVYPADADQVDIHHQYLLQLSGTGATSTPEPTVTPTFTPAPSPTSTPTRSVPVP